MISLKSSARLGLASLMAALTAAVPGLGQSSAQTQVPGGPIQVASDGNRLTIGSPYLYLEFNLRKPAVEVLRVAPNGDRRYGASLGWLVEEAVVGGKHLRSWTEDADGARASWLSRASDLHVRIDGIDVGAGVSSTWLLTIGTSAPGLLIERSASVKPNSGVESVGLGVVGPSVPEGASPTSVAHMLNGGAYRFEVGPRELEQPGGLIGLLAVDNPELSFSARSSQPDRVAARYEGDRTSLAFVRRVPARQGLQLQEQLSFKFGWNNDFTAARSDVSPDVESRLLASGYFGNAVIAPELGPVLSASMRDYRGSVWSRDVDYAMQGYSYVLHDMSVFRNTLQHFLSRVDHHGVAPENILLDGRYVNRESWDSMVNVVEATHTYVAKTGDLDFYRRNEVPVKKAMNWVRGLDQDGDGLPDLDIFPYGYTDTVENGPMHTYAIAKFYAGYQALGALEDAAGGDGEVWREYAQRTKLNFARPLPEGGYWNPATGYPIAWKRANGALYTTFETFGIFEAIRVGLLDDPWQLESIAAWLDANRDAFVNGIAYPERLMIGGYDPLVRKNEVPLEKLWIMDCNAPWITGISVPARVQMGRLADARAMLDVYANSSHRPTPHAEFGAGPLHRYGPGETADGGRLWDNWSWFNAVYGTHFGLKMTIPALQIEPAPLFQGAGQQLSGVSYQGAEVQMGMFPGGYAVMLTAPRKLSLKPPYGYSSIDVNGDGAFGSLREVDAQPNVWYVIRGNR